MRTLGSFALSICGAAALLVGCGGSQSLIGAPHATGQTSSTASSYQYRVLHRFGYNRRYRNFGGANPAASLIDVDGTLYGTTWRGGKSGNGTVYSISTTGEKKLVYSFQDGSSDGAIPEAVLLDVNGTLYGTTYSGGNTTCPYFFACGTVFSVTPAGVETVLYKFKGGSDGAHPVSPLIDVNGTLYGTTSEGGGNGCISSIGTTYGCGTVYSITTSGQETVLHAFSSFSEGEYPGGLIAVKGVLYGLTSRGGSHGCGTVFKMTTSGSKKLLHSFNCYSDGGNPGSALVDVRGTLYGTSGFGGTYGYGTVFSMSTNGNEKVLYNFAGVPDGALPSGLVYISGLFYGTTFAGGTSTCGPGSYTGCGTIYSLSPSGLEKVLYRFKGGSDGWAVQPPLVGVNHTLYGATSHGGGKRGCPYGCGTVFALTP